MKISTTDTDQPIYTVSYGGVYNYVRIFYGISPMANNHGKLYNFYFFESSYSSELYGMLAGILCFIKLCTTNRRQLQRSVNQHRDSDVDLKFQLTNEIKKLEDDAFII